MQVNSRNLRALGISILQAFDPCTNISAGATILSADYANASRLRGPGQAALQAALSAYNTGDFYRGFENGYVARYYGGSAFVPTTVGARAPASGCTSRPQSFQGCDVDLQPNQHSMLTSPNSSACALRPTRLIFIILTGTLVMMMMVFGPALWLLTMLVAGAAGLATLACVAVTMRRGTVVISPPINLLCMAVCGRPILVAAVALHLLRQKIANIPLRIDRTTRAPLGTRAAMERLSGLALGSTEPGRLNACAAEGRHGIRVRGCRLDAACELHCVAWDRAMAQLRMAVEGLGVVAVAALRGIESRCARVAQSQRRWCCGRSHVRAVLRITALHQGRHRISAAAQTCSSRALG